MLAPGAGPGNLVSWDEWRGAGPNVVLQGLIAGVLVSSVLIVGRGRSVEVQAVTAPVLSLRG